MPYAHQKTFKLVVEKIFESILMDFPLAQIGQFSLVQVTGQHSALVQQFLIPAC